MTILTIASDVALDAAAIATDAEAVATGPRAGRSDWALLAAGLCAEAPGAGAVHLPGTAESIAERAARIGFESAAFVTGDALREESGLLQGWFHGFDGPSLAAIGPDDPQGAAVELGYEFASGKAPRPMEDAGLLWVHLDLRGAADPAAVAAAAWQRLGEAAAARPETLRVLELLPGDEGAGALASTGGAPTAGDTIYSLVAARAALPDADADFPAKETCTTHHPSGELWSVRLFADGRPDRPWIAWGTDDYPRIERSYERGSRTGKWLSRAPSLHLIFERHYENDEPHGEWTRRDIEERVIEQGRFELGLKVGTWRTWHSNGQLASETTFAGGVPAAPTERWDPDGKTLPSTL